MEDLYDKKVLVATTSPFFAMPITEKLREAGAKVIISEQGVPRDRMTAATLLDEVGKTKPDAVLLHHPNFEVEANQEAVLHVASGLKRIMPVIVMDRGISKQDEMALQAAGAHPIHTDYTQQDQMAARIADIIMQRGRPARPWP